MKKSIGDICEILNGYSFKSEKYTNEGVRVIRIANVQNGYIEDATPQFYPNSEIDSFKDFLLQKNDLLISLTGNVGRVALLDEKFLPAALNQRVACLRPKSTAVSTKFLFYALSSERFIQDCEDSARGVAQKNMSTEWLKKYFINLPDAGTQLYWIKTLDVVTELIKKRKLQLRYLDQLASSRFIEMFGDPATNPRKWQTASLLDFGSCKNGMNYHANENGIKINCLGVGDFQDKSVIRDTSDLPVISLDSLPSSDYLLKDNDIVFVRSNGNKALVGRCVAVYPGNTPTVFSGFCIRFRQASSTVKTAYLLAVLRTSSVRKLMAGRGANIQNLNQQILASLRIPLPPLELQNEFAAFVEQLDKSKVTIRKSIEKLETTYRALLQEYFG